MHIVNRFFSSCPRLTAVALGVIMALTLMGVLELIFFGLNQNRCVNLYPSLVYSCKFHQPDEPLGYKPVPQVRAEVTKKLNENIIYKTSYAFDACGRRITPVGPPLERKKFIAFFGCSFTFGEGVREDETMPFYVGQLAPDFKPYNYGFSGYGPHQMLAKLQQPDVELELPEGHGLLIYTFIDPHIGRAIGSMREYNLCSHDMPYFTINQQNELVKKGNFTTGRPLLSLFYQIVGKLQFTKYFQLSIPPRITERHIRLTARIIEESCRIYRRRFPGSEFYMVIFPRSNNFTGVTPGLRQAGVKVLDYSALIPPYPQTGYAIEHDGHPSPLAYRELAGRMVQDLGLRANRSVSPRIARLHYMAVSDVRGRE